MLKKHTPNNGHFLVYRTPASGSWASLESCHSFNDRLFRILKARGEKAASMERHQYRYSFTPVVSPQKIGHDQIPTLM